MGCQASLIVSKEKNRHVWAIESFDNNHNHVMASAKSVLTDLRSLVKKVCLLEIVRNTMVNYTFSIIMEGNQSNDPIAHPCHTL